MVCLPRRRPIARAAFAGAALVASIVAAVTLGPGAPGSALAAPAAGKTATEDSVPSGDLAAVVDRAVAGMPGRASGRYVVPTQAEADRVAEVFRLARDGRLADSRRLARGVGYVVEQLRDVATGRVLVIVREALRSDGTVARGWGTFVHDAAATADVVVEVAHPVADLQTEAIGVAVFRRTPSRALLVAGAHRYANPGEVADVAHTPGTAFDAVHRSVVRAGSVVAQPHGFSAAEHPDLPEAVGSSGTAVPGPVASAVVSELGAAAFTACAYGEGCSELGGTTNLQGISARSVGAAFVHLELARALRDTAAVRDRVSAAVAAGLRSDD